MEEIVYSLNLDLRKNTHQVLVMKEGDVNSRVIEAVITDNGKPYDLTNCVVNLKWKKPDGHVVYSEINTVNDNTVTVVCTEQMLVAGGLAEAEFEIIDKTSEKVISTLKFSISINKTVSDNFEIESSDDFSALRTQYGVMKGHVEDTSIHLPTDGSSGQILKLDEDNNASWQDVFSLTKDEYEKLSNIEDNAEVNQNAFSNVKVGTTTISADSKTDTLTLVAGDNVTITPDANGDKITISSTNTTYSNATTSTAGLMSASDKTKLNGIATGANKTSIAANLTTTVAGSALDATMGKKLSETIEEQINRLLILIGNLYGSTGTLTDITVAAFEASSTIGKELGSAVYAACMTERNAKNNVGKEVLIFFTNGAIGKTTIKSTYVIDPDITWLTEVTVPRVSKTNIQNGTITLSSSSSTSSNGYSVDSGYGYGCVLEMSKANNFATKYLIIG